MDKPSLVAAVRRIRECKGEAAAQVVLENIILMTEAACAQICKKIADKHGKDDAAENEAELCMKLILLKRHDEV